MPIEIKELHIKIKVGDDGTASSPQTSGGTTDKEEIIEACVEQIMEILSKKEER
ncbi:DUF5908 family protein [uncultured Draconibacterium sp.]|uniref:DUF5908 family protein n=1 Tax=uncultured Draconibacterium sp. TaxID=1573823 RepID=UPI00321638E8